MTIYDVLTIGAGAAGLVAAARAAERGRKVLLLEKNRKTGVKILMSGGTRCNITQATDAAGIVQEFGPAGRFLHSALAALSPQDVVDLFESEGVKTKVESTGKIFPVSDRAIDVRDALMNRLRRCGAELAREEPVLGIQCSDDPQDARFQVRTEQRTISAKTVILTTGGQSYPGCGTTGDGYVWAKSLGHRIISPRPALVPITTQASWISDLQGLTIPDVELAVVDQGSSLKKSLARRRGSLLLTHFGFSGPVAMDISRAITGHHQPQSLEVICDFLPTESEQSLATRLTQMLQSQGSRQLANLKLTALPDRLWNALLQQAQIAPEVRAAELGKKLRLRLVEQLKATRVPVAGTRGFKKAEVTAGGVDLREVDSRTMQSKLVPGFYLAGEILDLDGPIGGYNFQAAFSTGYLAGSSV